MSSVIQGTLDEILAIRHNYTQSKALEDFFAQNDVVELRTADGELTVTHRKRKYVGTPDTSIYVSPSIAVELLQLWGHGGNYYRKDPKTGLHKERCQMLPDEQYSWYVRRGFDPDKINVAYFYHYEGQEQDAEIDPLEELSKSTAKSNRSAKTEADLVTA